MGVVCAGVLGFAGFPSSGWCAPAPSVLWAATAENTGSAYGWNVAVDHAGNSLVVGEFDVTLAIGNTNLSHTGTGYGWHSVLAKYNGSGVFQWATVVDGTSRAVAVDGSGNSYITGWFNGSAVFGNETLAAAGPGEFTEIFVAKYNAQGQVQWARSAGGTQFDAGLGIAADEAGNCYVTGYFGNPSGGEATFGTNVLTSAGNGDVFLARYDTTGQLSWVRRSGTAVFDLGAGVALDGQGHCFITGRFTNFFLARYDINGQLGWTRETGDGMGKAVAADAAGNCFVIPTPAAGSNTLVLKYSGEGNVLWSQAGQGEVGAENVAVDTRGRCYVMGGFQAFHDGEPEDVWFGQPFPTATNTFNAFVTQFSESGAPGWLATFAADVDYDMEARCVGIKVDAVGQCYVAGTLNGTAYLGGLTLTNLGQTLFVTKLGVPPTLVNPRTYFGFELAGTTGQTYQIEYCGSLASSNWTWLTNVTPVSSPQLFIDTTSPASGQRFYRVRQGP